MSKKYIITEKQLDTLYEQGNKELSDLNKYTCVPELFRAPTDFFVKKKYNIPILKAALGIISRESDFGGSKRYSVLGPIKALVAKLGVNTSVGPGQIKPETAKSLGLSVDDINSAQGAIEGVYKILINNYSIALKRGYTNSVSSNFKSGTGNSALDMAIMAFNTGEHKIFKYCKTSDPKIAKNCKFAGKDLSIETDKKVQPNAYTPMSAQLYSAKTKGTTTIKVYDEPLENYIPNYKTTRIDGVNISTHGYISEVTKKIRELSCF